MSSTRETITITTAAAKEQHFISIPNYSPCFEFYILSFGLFKTPTKLEQKEGSETSARKIHTPGNHPKVILKHFIFFGFNAPCHLLCSFSEINFRRINIFKHFVILRGWTVCKPQSPVIAPGNVTYGEASMHACSLVT